MKQIYFTGQHFEKFFIQKNHVNVVFHYFKKMLKQKRVNFKKLLHSK